MLFTKTRDRIKWVIKMKEYDLVRTLVDKEGFKKGSKGIVVAFYLDGKGVNVEIQDDNNHPIDVATYEIDEIELWNE